MLFLQQFNYDIVYKPGRTNSNADAMSRIPAKENTIAVIQDVCSLDKIREEQAKDKQLHPLLDSLEKQQPLPRPLAPGLRQVFILNGVLCRHFGEASKVQTVFPEALKCTVLEHMHNKAGHLSITKMLEKVKERFYLPGQGGFSQMGSRMYTASAKKPTHANSTSSLGNHRSKLSI